MIRNFEVKGRCPGALAPMMSGDGLVVRIRPRAGQVTAAQAHGIAQAAREYGNGVIDLSSRANLQLRGVRAETHGALLKALDALGLLDDDPATEARRNIVVTPFWSKSGVEPALAPALEAGLAASDLALPGKFGFAVDCGPRRVLNATPADIRIERSDRGKLIVRADGAQFGLPIAFEQAAVVALALARWFIASGGISEGRGRMAAHIRKGAVLPAHLAGTELPAAQAAPATPGLVAGGALVAMAFGSMTADSLEKLASAAAELRVTPWRMVFLPGSDLMPTGLGIISQANDPLLRVESCPGAPWCPQARAETRLLARELASHVPLGKTLHVSGCAKGCACARPVALTLVATSQGYDLVCNGTASATPVVHALSADEILSQPARYLGGL